MKEESSYKKQDHVVDLVDDSTDDEEEMGKKHRLGCLLTCARRLGSRCTTGVLLNWESCQN